MTTMTDTVVQCPSCGKKNRVPAAASGVPRCGNCRVALPWIADADDDTFAEVIDVSSIPVLVDLWAPWCGPCRMVSPALENLAREFAGRLKLVKVNVDEAPRTAERFTVRSIPTLLLLREGRVVSSQIGAAPRSAIKSWLDGALGSPD